MESHLQRHLLGVRLKLERLDEDENRGKARHGTKCKQGDNGKLLAFRQMKFSNLNGRQDENRAVDQNMRQYC